MTNVWLVSSQSTTECHVDRVSFGAMPLAIDKCLLPVADVAFNQASPTHIAAATL